MKRLAVIRVKGTSKASKAVLDTLKMLRINRVNHCNIIDDRETYKGMLQKAKDYITWGEVDAGDVELLLKNRGELTGGTKLTDSYIKENTKFDSIKSFSESFVKFESELTDIPELVPMIRLHPPRKGHRGIKNPFSLGGTLGDRGPEIKNLIYKMR